MDYRDDYERGRRYRGEGYYGGYYGYPGERDWDRREWERRRGEESRRRGDDRGFFERAGDEVRSWFGDEEAERRRERDERDEPRGWGGRSYGWGGPSRGWGGGRDEEVDRDWARQWGYVERRGGGREPQRSSPPQRYMGPSWARDVGYGGEGWERYVERPGWGDPSAWGAERAEGPHAGRGPRGYTRSDDRIREDVCDRLCEHGLVDAGDIEVRVTAGEVTLQGTVPERQQKRIAEDVAERVAGVREVHNNLRVNREGGAGHEGGAEPGRPFRAA
jgi:osmotically-inducible protein OsmY